MNLFEGKELFYLIVPLLDGFRYLEWFCALPTQVFELIMIHEEISQLFGPNFRTGNSSHFNFFFKKKYVMYELIIIHSGLYAYQIFSESYKLIFWDVTRWWKLLLACHILMHSTDAPEQYPLFDCPTSLCKIELGDSFAAQTNLLFCCL